jgi:hypothetical protein
VGTWAPGPRYLEFIQRLELELDRFRELLLPLKLRKERSGSGPSRRQYLTTSVYFRTYGPGAESPVPWI